MHECTDEGWDVTLSHNLNVAFRMSRAVILRMLEQEVHDDGIRGSIVNLSSALVERPEPQHFATHAYAAAKGAVAAMTRSMAAYYAPHKIRVNAIAPGMVRTAVSERAAAGSELMDLIRRKQPLAEDMIDAGAVASAAVFLLSRDAAAITGQVLAVDGAWGLS